MLEKNTEIRVINFNHGIFKPTLGLDALEILNNDMQLNYLI